MGYSPWGCKELGTTERLTLTYLLTYEGNVLSKWQLFEKVGQHRRSLMKMEEDLSLKKSTV